MLEMKPNEDKCVKQCTQLLNPTPREQARGMRAKYKRPYVAQSEVTLQLCPFSPHLDPQPHWHLTINITIAGSRA